jgi:hypothetical protein
VAEADLADEGGQVAAIGGIGELAGGKAAGVLGLEGGEVFANEVQVGGARARFQEEGLRGEEAGAGLGGEPGHAVERGFGVGDAGEQRRAEDAGGEAGLAEVADGGEAKVRAGCVGFKEPGERGVGRGDGEVQDEGVALGDALEEVDVAGDEAGFGDDAEAMAGAPGEDFEQAAGNAGAALDGLVGVGGGAEGDLLGGVDMPELLFEEPRGVLFEEDEAFEGFGGTEIDRLGRGERDAGGGWGVFGGEELVSVAGVAVAAGELAAAIGVDGVGEPGQAAGDGLVENAADFEGAEFDEVAIVGVLGLGGEAGETGEARLQDGEEGCGIGSFFSCSLNFRLSKITVTLATTRVKD